jgi:hypothetical protein
MSSDEYKKQYYQKNKERIKQYYEDNKERIKKDAKEYQLKNKEKIKIRVREYARKNRRENNKRQVTVNIRSLFVKTLKRQCVNKTDLFFKYTDIPMENYINHFEKNYPIEYLELTTKGKYHIDHIIPCKCYDLSDNEEIKKCWHPENMRLILAEENLIKNDKVDFDLIKKHNIEFLLPKEKKRQKSLDIQN